MAVKREKHRLSGIQGGGKGAVSARVPRRSLGRAAGRTGFQAEAAACTTCEQGQVLPVRRAPEANVVEQRDGDGEEKRAGSEGKPSQEPSCESHRWEATQTG